MTATSKTMKSGKPATKYHFLVLWWKAYMAISPHGTPDKVGPEQPRLRSASPIVIAVCRHGLVQGEQRPHRTSRDREYVED